MLFLNGYRPFLLSHDSLEYRSLGDGKSCNSQHLVFIDCDTGHRMKSTSFFDKTKAWGCYAYPTLWYITCTILWHTFLSATKCNSAPSWNVSGVTWWNEIQSMLYWGLRIGEWCGPSSYLWAKSHLKIKHIDYSSSTENEEYMDWEALHYESKILLGQIERRCPTFWSCRIFKKRIKGEMVLFHILKIAWMNGWSLLPVLYDFCFHHWIPCWG